MGICFVIVVLLFVLSHYCLELDYSRGGRREDGEGVCVRIDDTILNYACSSENNISLSCSNIVVPIIMCAPPIEKKVKFLLFKMDFILDSTKIEYGIFT